MHAQSFLLINGPFHTYPDISETEIFFLRFQKIYASTLSVFELFSPVHTHTLNNGNTIALVTEHA